MKYFSFCCELIYISSQEFIRGTSKNGDASSDAGFSKDNIVSCARKHHKIEIAVHLFDVQVPVILMENSYIEEAVYKAMARLKIWISDFYTTDRRAMLQMDDMIGKSRKVVVNKRLRGGNGDTSTSGPGRVRLDHFIAGLQHKENPRWMERVDVPASLRRVNQKEEYFVDLGADALFVLVLMFDLLERTNDNNECYGSSFELSHIFFLPEYGVLMMDEKIERKKLNQKGFKDNLETVENKLLKVHYIYSKPDGAVHYPKYVNDLVWQIFELKNKGGWAFSMQRRLLIYNHPCTWSSSRRINTSSLVVQYSKGLGQADKTAFNRAMKNIVMVKWKDDLSDQFAAPAMKEVFLHAFWDGNTTHLKVYHPSLMGKCDLIRCLLHHAMDCQVIPPSKSAIVCSLLSLASDIRKP